ncbi:DUF4440 domain-containing protein [Caldibacillus debilis]|uniref:DUF4440 domain-containing protein n=1 Tax=Caldibacillus debilis TaxID=301148 RepID=UPI0023F03D1B|nr:DUF4440 domain-containing protein [Caldibacillus debilis]
MPEVRTSPEKIDRLLSDDFFEFGSSGRIRYKADFLGENGLGPVKTKIVRFEVHPLADDVVLAAYILFNEEKKEYTLRSSIGNSRTANGACFIIRGRKRPIRSEFPCRGAATETERNFLRSRDEHRMRVPALRKNVAFRASWRPRIGQKRQMQNRAGIPESPAFRPNTPSCRKNFLRFLQINEKKRRHRILHKCHQTPIGKTSAFSWLGYLEIRDGRENRAVPVSFRRCLPTCVDRRFRLF